MDTIWTPKDNTWGSQSQGFCLRLTLLDSWVDKKTTSTLSVEEMRDPLPADVAGDFRGISQSSDFYGGHGGSHAYLVHEFVDAIAHDRTPAINAWETARYMAAGAWRTSPRSRRGRS